MPTFDHVKGEPEACEPCFEIVKESLCLVPMLKAGQFGSAHAIPGMTGLLSIDQSGHVKRELDWAKVSGGRAVPLGTVATAATN